MTSPSHELRKARDHGDRGPRLVAISAAIAAALTFLVVGAGPSANSDRSQRVWVNGHPATVSAYATVEEVLRASPADWPASQRVDIDGNPIDRIQVTPTITINGSAASLDTPTAPYSRVSVEPPTQVTEDLVTETVPVSFDGSPHIWSRLWREGSPGSASIAVGTVSGKRGAPVVTAAPVPAKSHGDDAVAALTFDDGPDPTWTPVILDILREKGVKATFFVLGGRAQAYPDLIRQAAAEGHSVQNHSWNHPPGFEALPYEVVFDEMNGTSSVIESLTGRRPRFCRPPGGGLSGDVEAASGQLGMKLAMWNVDPQDWAGKNADEIYTRVTQGLGGGDMILMHDGGGDRGQTAAALPGIIDDLRSKGFAFVTLG